ncbi:MAG: MBL fold metallo-hydrolase [Anaerolineae bacterium]|nr:MAG: MBL fold metallo-hydrolase [Anaerolineae bacterium]
MSRISIHTLDLHFQHRETAIAAYLIRHADGAVLVECGPGSTIESLKTGLQAHGLSLEDVTHVFLSHIHLDHAGAAGYLARQGAEIYVHPVGAPHLRNPEKLLASAKRIYEDQMDALWGEFLPVPEERLHTPQDGEEIAIGNLRIVAVDTPGHAKHHYAYLVDGTCFTGDIGGVRMPGQRYLRLPLVPPDLHLETWRESIRRLQRLKPKRIAPTHFGIYEDADWHLQAVLNELDAVSRWLEEVMPADPSVEELGQKVVAWMETRGLQAGVDKETLRTYEIANPTWMSATGLQRYWRKFRQPAS